MSTTKTTEELLAHAVRHAGYRSCDSGRPRWSHVGDVFGLGSTSATGLCVRFGVNPFEMVDGQQCEWARIYWEQVDG